MQHEYTAAPLLVPLRRHLTRPQWQNLVLLIVAVQLARTLIQRQLALYLVCAISSASCYRRLQRLLAAEAPWGKALQRLWLRTAVAHFAPGRGRLVLLIDWTWHRDRCRSFWIMLPVGGRAVPLAFFLAPPALGGAGSQRTFEDQALRQLRRWLGWRRPVLLIGDRSFGGRDRIRFLRNQRFQFVLRVHRTTMILVDGRWTRLQELAPPVGQRRRWSWVLLGKEKPKERLAVNVVAVHQPLRAPQPLLTHKGKLTGQSQTETTWFLVTDLPASTDAVALYQTRMQIEETFRDFKAVLGLEQEQTKQPWVRLPALLWAVTIGMALDLQAGGAERPVLPRCAPTATAAPAAPVPRYRSESAMREGLHTLVVQLLLGQSPFTPELQAIAAKTARLQARPQVQKRRRRTPAGRRRVKAHLKGPVHA
jgi:hypothetical protein